VFYFCDFSDFSRQFPNAKLKTRKTAKQEIAHALEIDVFKAFYKPKALPTDLTLNYYDTIFKDRGEKVALLTHLPVDLLWRAQFKELTLLESHTGALKKRAAWYSKLTGGSQMTRIPFNRLTLQVFGENLYFSAMLPGIRNRVLEMAEKDQWTSVTTDERIRASIQKLYDPREKTFFLDLLGH
jgi:hypothetical protein